MIANYHAHTYRCGHAEGSERDYAEKASQAGLRTLGISDHTPYDFFDIGPRNRPMRMMPEELPEYADSVRTLAEEYRGKLDILLGVEAEYYPKYFPRLLELLKGSGVQYMILGQHFLNNEVDGQYCGSPARRLRPWNGTSPRAVKLWRPAFSPILPIRTCSASPGRTRCMCGR